MKKPEILLFLVNFHEKKQSKNLENLNMCVKKKKKVKPTNNLSNSN